MKKNYISTIIFSIISSLSVFSQAVVSTQSHEGNVNCIISSETSTLFDRSFYSAGNDGFVIKWSSDGMGEHFQVSELQIPIVVKNPVAAEIAVYETNGISVHKLTVLDSKTFSKKFSKKFTDPITSISYSEKGNFLIAGTTSVNGTYIINAKTGAILKKASDVSGIITFARTGDSEKTAVMYSKTGSLIYYDLTTLKQKAKFNTEQNLEQAVLFGSGKMRNRFFAGVKDNIIYLIDATSGRVIGQYNATNPLIFTSRLNSEEKQGLYFTTSSGKTFSLKLIDSQMLQDQIGASATKALSPQPPLIVKNFTGLRSKDSFTCGAKNAGEIMLGTKHGDIYSMTDIPESELYSMFPITENMYEKIYDIENDGNDFYFLTRNSIFKTTYEDKVIQRLAMNPAYTNLLKTENSIILWSQNTAKPVQKISMETGENEILFTPKASLRTARISGTKIIYILGTSICGVFDLTTKENSEIYTGTSIQDAVLVNENTIVVAKTSTGSGDSPLISVNIQTGETVPLKFNGNVAFSLTYDNSKENSPLYGITIKTDSNGTKTEVFSYNIKTAMYSSLLRLSEEDSSAFTLYKYPMIYSNIGKNHVYAYNLQQKKNFSFKRSASMPKKITCSSTKAAILNHNGSISWYNTTSSNQLSAWYLDTTGQWSEF